MKKILVLVMLMASWCYSANYYVSHYAGAADGTDGHDGSNDTTKAWKTIQYALDTVNASTASHTIWVKADADYVIGVDQTAHDAATAIKMDTTCGSTANKTYKTIRGYTGSPGSEVSANVTIDCGGGDIRGFYIYNVDNENENIKADLKKIYSDNSSEHKDIIEKVDLQSSKIDTLMGKVDVMLDIKNAPKTGCLAQ